MIIILFYLSNDACAADASYCWLQSNRVVPAPVEPTTAVDAMELELLDAQVNIGNIQLAIQDSARQSQTAAKWAAASALLSAFTAIAGIFTLPLSRLM